MFGLGNSTYEFFNGAAKKAEKHLSAAGANRLGKLGEADDGAGTTDEDYMAWKDSILDLLKDELHLDEQEAKTIIRMQGDVIDESVLSLPPVSYTHLDVYKRQLVPCYYLAI